MKLIDERYWLFEGKQKVKNPISPILIPLYLARPWDNVITLFPLQ
jgi:hypothetical protein